MTTGMKKFTKGCLITALVAFIIGAVICCVGGMLGGFKVLNSMDIREVTGIPLVYRFGPDGRFEYGFRPWRDSGIDWGGKYENWQRIDNEEGGRALSLTADTLRELYIEAGACEVRIEESEDDQVRLAVSGDADTVRYHVDDGSLWIERQSGWRWFQVGVNKSSDKVYLYLPKGTNLDYLDIELGAGKMDSIGLKAQTANIEVGAGEADIDSLTVDDEVILSIGAGKIRVKELICETADLDIGAGELDVDDATIEEVANIDLGMGSVNISGIIKGDLDVDCGMGQVTLELFDDEQDHNYDVDCSMGEVRVGSHSYSSMSSSQTIDNGTDSDYNIDCSMGTVKIIFK